jgi:hypothetical protein
MDVKEIERDSVVWIAFVWVRIQKTQALVKTAINIRVL